MSEREARDRAAAQRRFAERKLRASDIANLIRREAYAMRQEEHQLPADYAIQRAFDRLADRLEGKR